MPDYTVSYVIEVDAESPEDAAREVAAILADGGAMRGVYTVTDDDGESTDVDLATPEDGF